eukprot:1009768-Rhodomonas_salina.3
MRAVLVPGHRRERHPRYKTLLYLLYGPTRCPVLTRDSPVPGFLMLSDAMHGPNYENQSAIANTGIFDLGDRIFTKIRYEEAQESSKKVQARRIGDGTDVQARNELRNRLKSAVVGSYASHVSRVVSGGGAARRDPAADAHDRAGQPPLRPTCYVLMCLCARHVLLRHVRYVLRAYYGMSGADKAYAGIECTVLLLCVRGHRSRWSTASSCAMRSARTWYKLLGRRRGTDAVQSAAVLTREVVVLTARCGTRWIYLRYNGRA